MNENTLNLAVAVGANIEYRADGTILIKPKGFEVKATQTQPQEWREPQSPPVGAREHDIQQQRQAILHDVSSGIRLSNLGVNPSSVAEVYADNGLVRFNLTTRLDILLIAEKQDVLRAVLPGESPTITVPVLPGQLVVLLVWQQGTLYRTDHLVKATPPKPLTPAVIAVALIEGNLDKLLPPPDRDTVTEVVVVDGVCTVPTSPDTIVAVTNCNNEVCSITSSDSNTAKVFANLNDYIYTISVTESVANVNLFECVDKLKPTPLESLLSHIKDHPESKVNVSLTAGEICDKYSQRGLQESGYLLSASGLFPITDDLRSLHGQIAVIHRDYKTSVIYIAGCGDTYRSNILYLADAIAGLDSDTEVLENILSTGGKYADCTRVPNTTLATVEERRCVPFREYFSSLTYNRKGVDYEIHSAGSFRDMYGKDLTMVDNLMLVTTEGVRPWSSQSPVGVGRLMLTYLKGSGDLVVARYSTTPRAVYAEMIKVLKGKPYDADIIDAIFSTAI